MRVIGLMSGTSMDGVDAAVVTIESGAPAGDITLQIEAHRTVPYAAEVREALASFSAGAPAVRSSKSVVRDVCALNFAIGEAFASAAIAVAGTASGSIDLIGSHGQTVYHLPDDDGAAGFARSTLQIGEPAVIAERTGITCVADFRVADMAAGGQGAPLVSYVDYLMLRDAREDRAALNIGGIANLTLLPAGAAVENIRAFDTGPGNMLIDQAVAHFSDGRSRYDERGAIAAGAGVCGPLLDWLAGHPYFTRLAPKTTGREMFGGTYFHMVLEAAHRFGAGAEQTISTLTALTARTIACAVPSSVRQVIVSGGGAYNDTLMAGIRAALAERSASPPGLLLSSDFGIPPDAKEAVAFAVLARETIHGRPGNVPSATGAARATILGKIVPGKNYATLMGRLHGFPPDRL